MVRYRGERYCAAPERSWPCRGWTPCNRRAAARSAEPQIYTFRVTGLFQPDRVDDFCAVPEKLPDVRPETLDYDRAWIDPARTNRAALEEALKKRNVQLGETKPN